MPAISRTPANFRITSSTIYKQPRIQLGESVEPGQQIYQSSADSKYYLSNNAAEESVTSTLVAANYGDADDYIDAIEKGNFDPGGTVVIGKVYGSNGAGEWLPIDEITTGQFINYRAIGLTANLLRLINVTNVIEAP